MLTNGHTVVVDGPNSRSLDELPFEFLQGAPPWASVCLGHGVACLSGGGLANHDEAGQSDDHPYPAHEEQCKAIISEAIPRMAISSAEISLSRSAVRKSGSNTPICLIASKVHRGIISTAFPPHSCECHSSPQLIRWTDDSKTDAFASQRHPHRNINGRDIG